jgi:hypothetical protein
MRHFLKETTSIQSLLPTTNITLSLILHCCHQCLLLFWAILNNYLMSSIQSLSPTSNITLSLILHCCHQCLLLFWAILNNYLLSSIQSLSPTSNITLSQILHPYHRYRYHRKRCRLLYLPSTPQPLSNNT